MQTMIDKISVVTFPSTGRTFCNKCFLIGILFFACNIIYAGNTLFFNVINIKCRVMAMWAYTAFVRVRYLFLKFCDVFFKFIKSLDNFAVFFTFFKNVYNGIKIDIHVKTFLYNVWTNGIIKETFSGCKRVFVLCLLNCIKGIMRGILSNISYTRMVAAHLFCTLKGAPCF